MSHPKTTPVHVNAPHGSQVTEITWGDGHRCAYPNDILRGWCPCAHCQGHGGRIEFVPGGDSQLRVVEAVGNYALKLGWGDGHDTGLYTFEYLRDLCERPEVSCSDVEQG